MTGGAGKTSLTGARTGYEITLGDITALTHIITPVSIETLHTCCIKERGTIECISQTDTEAVFDTSKGRTFKVWFPLFE